MRRLNKIKHPKKTIEDCFDDKSGICVIKSETLNAKQTSLMSSLDLKFGFLCLYSGLEKRSLRMKWLQNSTPFLVL